MKLATSRTLRSRRSTLPGQNQWSMETTTLKKGRPSESRQCGEPTERNGHGYKNLHPTSGCVPRFACSTQTSKLPCCTELKHGEQHKPPSRDHRRWVIPVWVESPRSTGRKWSQSCNKEQATRQWRKKWDGKDEVGSAPPRGKPASPVRSWPEILRVGEKEEDRETGGEETHRPWREVEMITKDKRRWQRVVECLCPIRSKKPY